MVGRRHFMLWLGAAVSTLARLSLLDPLSRRARPTRLDRAPSRLVARVATNLFSDPAGVRRLGARYLSLHRGEDDRGGLSRRIERRLSRHQALDSAEAIRRAVVVEVQRDFADGRVVLIDGWVVSRLEARLCALCTAA